ncbi:MAG: M23 family metallopeptidase [Caldilineaceae bacterium]|nr:M23 family metallopeptidase [Caldilineaceae bacterium]
MRRAVLVAYFLTVHLLIFNLPVFAQETAPTPLITTPTPTATITPTPLPTPTVTPTPAPVPSELAGYALYTVQPGDTLLRVALELGLDVAEMACVVAPDHTWDRPLVIGDRLSVPPPAVICHTTQPGDTVDTIAAQYADQGITPHSIRATAWNQLARWPDPLPGGLHLRIVPLPAPVVLAPSPTPQTGVLTFGQMLQRPVAGTFSTATGGPTSAQSQANVPANWPYGSGHFAWPLYGWITQGFHVDQDSTHRGLDIAAREGTLVTAADRGVVIRAGWNDQGYGNLVIIDHNIDYLTLYAHLDQIDVAEGDIVAQGQVIGTVGSTGNSTGPHLHFEIRDFGNLTDPLGLLGR